MLQVDWEIELEEVSLFIREASSGLNSVGKGFSFYSRLAEPPIAGTVLPTELISVDDKSRRHLREHGLPDCPSIHSLYPPTSAVQGDTDRYCMSTSRGQSGLQTEAPDGIKLCCEATALTTDPT